MKRSIILPIVAVTLGVGGLLASPQAPPQTTRVSVAGPTGAGVQEDDLTTLTLRQELAATQETVAQLAVELSEMRLQLEQTLDYLQRQQAAAKAMTETLAAAEAAGFKAGINHQSREILVSGWRKQLTTAATPLPAAAAPSQPKPQR